MSGAFRHDHACDCDVLVVGGGLVGLAASMFLAQKGLRVWVVGAARLDIEQNESTVTANVGADGRT